MRQARLRDFVAIAGGVLCLSSWAVAQQNPVFRSGVDRVAVDFVAVGSDGMPVVDLKPSDLALKVDGKVREIRSLELVKLSSSASAAQASALPPSEALPQPFGSNSPADAGRAIILIFHHTSLKQGEEKSAKTAAAAFIKTLGPRDRVALVTYQEGGVVVDLTTNHSRVLKAMESIQGHAPSASDFIPAQSAGMVASENAFAVRNLIPLMNSFSSIDGPKTVVFISAGLPGLSGNPSAFRTMDRAYEFQDVGRAAAKAHVRLYILQAHSLGGMDVSVNHPIVVDGLSDNGFKSSVQDGLQEFAGVTGGAVFHISGASTQAFERVRVESSSYYLLSFDAESRERDGKHHKISLTSGRPGLLVRARPEFLIEKAGVTTPAPSKTQTQSLLGDLLTYRDLPLRTVAYSFRAPAGQNTVIVATDTDGDSKISAASYALIDDKGRIAAQWDADANDLSTTPVVSATAIASGTYRLRVSAKAADGRLGAVDYEFKAGLAAIGPLSAGGLMLGRMDAGRFLPQIQFGDERSVTAYVEVYGKVPAGDKATVTIEIAPAADAAAAVSVPAEINDTRDDDRWIATAEVPLASLAPGDHVVRAVIKVGAASSAIVRTLRKR